MGRVIVPVDVSPQEQVRHPTRAMRVREVWAWLVDRLVVKSSSGTNVPYLDSLRGCAVLLVVVYHCWLAAGNPDLPIPVPFFGRINIAPLFANGYVGLNLFFILSGFLLSQYWFKADYLHRPPPNILIYLRHRFFRIVPGYYCCLFFLVLIFCPFMIDPDFVYSPHGMFIVAAHLLLMPGLLPRDLTYNYVLWTISVEVLFYLILPWIMPLLLRNRWLLTLPVVAVVSVAWRHFALYSLDPLARSVARIENILFPQRVTDAMAHYVLFQQLPTFLVYFLLGAALANLFVRYQNGLLTGRIWWFLTHHWAGKIYFFAGWIIVVWWMQVLGVDAGNEASPGATSFVSYAGKVAIPAGFALVLAGAILGGRRLQSLFAFIPLRFIGIISYSMYLWHAPIIFLISHFPAIEPLAPTQRFLPILGHATLVTVLISSFTYVIIERPFLMLGRHMSTTR